MEELVRLQRYAEGLASGLLTPNEVASAVLDLLTESPDRTGLWTHTPAPIREVVMAYLDKYRLDSLPPPFRIGLADPEWLRAQAMRRREIAADLLASVKSAAVSEGDRK